MTETELKILESSKDDLVIKLLEEYKSFKEDPAKIFYLQITEVIKTLSDDMKHILEGKYNDIKLIRGDKDLKHFDQVKVLLLDTETIFKGLKYAREHIMPELKKEQDKQENEVGLSAVDRLSNAKRINNK